MTASPAVHPTSDPAPATPAPVVLLMEKIRALAEQRRLHAQHREEHTKGIIAFQEAYPAFFSQVAEEKVALEHELKHLGEVETEVKALVLAAYHLTQNKKPAPGTEVRLFTTLAYDRERALVWAKEKGLALIPEQLDEVAFAEIAVAAKLDFVQVNQEPRPQLSKDLDKALGIAEMTA